VSQLAATSGAALFGRRVQVEIGKPGQSGRSWTDLRIAFDIKKGTGRSPNEARIEIYNLNRDSENACQEDGAMVRLLAGYGTPSLIFQGDIDQVLLERRPPDRVTVIQARDAGQAFSRARIRKTISGQTTARKVLGYLADAAELALGPLGLAADVIISQGLALNGPVRDELDRIAATLGVDWWVTDGQLVALQPGEHTGETVVDLGPDSGLVGSPTPVVEKNRATKGVEVVALLQPAISPGRRFRLRSARYTGIYRAEQVSHAGDSFGGDFYTKIRANLVTGV
jgi:hypothetical protein